MGRCGIPRKLSAKCRCRPVVEFIEQTNSPPNVIVSHNAWDGREYVEEAIDGGTGRPWKVHVLEPVG